MHEGVDGALPHPVLAHLAHQLAGAGGDPVLQVGGQFGLRQQGLDHTGLVGAVVGAQAGAQRIGLRERLGKDHDRTLRKDRPNLAWMFGPEHSRIPRGWKQEQVP